MLKTLSGFVLFFCLIMIGSSCFNSKKYTYFDSITDTTVALNGEATEYTIQKNDLLSIYISSLDDKASAQYNVTNTFVLTSSTAAGSTTQVSGYLVNVDGNIQMPQIGNIKASGLTKKQLKETITNIFLDKKLLLEPIVTIRQLNYEVTVIGEVSRPSVISVPNEKISILKALGLAGDITIFGRKENVLLIREKDGKKKVVRLNLNSRDFIQSPYYFLQPNDVVYVEADKNKVSSNSRSLLLLPTILSSISLIAVTLLQIFRK